MMATPNDGTGAVPSFGARSTSDLYVSDSPDSVMGYLSEPLTGSEARIACSWPGSGTPS
jgi:hypothetical protein